jgi:hypothetical protein
MATSFDPYGRDPYRDERIRMDEMRYREMMAMQQAQTYGIGGGLGAMGISTKSVQKENELETKLLLLEEV